MYQQAGQPSRYGVLSSSTTTAATTSSPAASSSPGPPTSPTTIATVVPSAVHAASSAAAIRLVLGLLLFDNVDNLVGNSKVFDLGTCQPRGRAQETGRRAVLPRT